VRSYANTPVIAMVVVAANQVLGPDPGRVIAEAAI
jgi:hypothetical protein